MRERPRGPYVSSAIALVALVVTTGMATAAYAGPSSEPVDPSAAAPTPSSSATAQLPGWHDGPSTEMPNLTPEQLGSVRSKQKLAARQSGAQRASSGVMAATYPPNCRLYGSQTPSRATFQGVDTWRIVNETYMYGTSTDGTPIENFCQIGKARLIMQRDGNLVLRDENGASRWDTATWNNPGAFMRLINGSVAIYKLNGQLLRYSNPIGSSSWNLHVQADGNLVMYAPVWDVIWATGTQH